MRIITGKARGLQLTVPKTYDVRPTADRVKESVFNIIGSKIIGATVLDLFAGTGNLGLESWSRGAAAVTFIDASKEFEKVKTQNKLRPQHIKKIVDTYRERKEIEKYSHLATLQEVAENDYNLNIPRYVDTFEEEEPIDIHAVMKEIKELEAKRADLDKEIEGYLKELGLA